MLNEQNSKRRWSQRHRIVTRLVPLPAILFALLPISGSRTAHAQVQSIIVNEPSEWRFRDTVLLGNRKTLLISGSATDPSGVSQILVNGSPVAFKKDSQNPRFVLFETTVSADSIKDKTTLTLVPVKGTRFERSFNADSPLIQQRRRAAATVILAAETSVVKPLVPDSQRTSQPLQRRDPFPAFRKRSIGYGAAAGVGVLFIVLSKSDKGATCTTSSTSYCTNAGGSSGARTFGVGLVAASVAALTVDAFLIHRRENKVKQDEASKAPTSGALQFEAPAILGVRHGLGLGVLHLSFR